MTGLFPERIETERLVLDPLTTEAVDVIELFDHCRVGAPHIEDVTEFLTWAPHETPKDTAEFVAAMTEQREADEGATYVVRPREGEPGAGEMAGLTGIGANWDRRTAELGIWLHKPFWGRGYSGERAAAMFDVAFDRLALDVVVVEVHVGNEQSRRAVEKYVEAHGGRREGLLRNGCADRDGEPADVHRFSVTSEEYADATAE